MTPLKNGTKKDDSLKEQIIIMIIPTQNTIPSIVLETCCGPPEAIIRFSTKLKEYIHTFIANRSLENLQIFIVFLGVHNTMLYIPTI
jgi:hypothetical protein